MLSSICIKISPFASLEHISTRPYRDPWPRDESLRMDSICKLYEGSVLGDSGDTLVLRSEQARALSSNHLFAVRARKFYETWNFLLNGWKSSHG